MRKRGGSGGGTLCSGAPHWAQFSRATSCRRSHCPRTEHAGFKHTTVEPCAWVIVMFSSEGFRAGGVEGEKIAAELRQNIEHRQSIWSRHRVKTPGQSWVKNFCPKHLP